MYAYEPCSPFRRQGDGDGDDDDSDAATFVGDDLRQSTMTLCVDGPGTEKLKRARSHSLTSLVGLPKVNLETALVLQSLHSNSFDYKTLFKQRLSFFFDRLLIILKEKYARFNTSIKMRNTYMLLLSNQCIYFLF